MLSLALVLMDNTGVLGPGIGLESLVFHFAINHRPTMGSISPYNIAGLSLKFPKK